MRLLRTGSDLGGCAAAAFISVYVAHLEVRRGEGTPPYKETTDGLCVGATLAVVHAGGVEPRPYEMATDRAV